MNTTLPPIPQRPYKARALALEQRLREAVAYLDSYADDMPFTVIGVAAHKALFKALLEGLQ